MDDLVTLLVKRQRFNASITEQLITCVSSFVSVQKTQLDCLSGNDMSLELISQPSDRAPNRIRSKEVLKALVSNDDNFVKQHFRITKASFSAICEFIRSKGFYLPSPRYANRSHAITCEESLAMLLLYLGHGCSLLIVAAICGVAKQTASKHVRRMQGILLQHMVPQSIAWPSTAEERDAVTSDFQLRSGGIPNIIGAVDGTHIEILTPSEDSLDYINRKGLPSLCFQGIAGGPRLKFLDWYGGWAGSVHDASIFKNSSIHHRFLSGEFEGYRLLGDAAYPLMTWLLTPYEKTLNQSEREAAFNYWHSSARMVVERAFGVLKSRFPLLKKPWTNDLDKVVSIVLICVALHNFCCDQDAEWECDEQHARLWLERAPVELNLEDDEDILPQRGVTAAAKAARNEAALLVPEQPERARRGQPFDYGYVQV